jgi:hypothetical protein
MDKSEVMNDHVAKSTERLQIRGHATKEEEKFYGLLVDFEDKYFEDLTLIKFQCSEITKVVHEDGEIEYADIDECKVSIAECLFRIVKSNPKDSVAAAYNRNEDTIIFYKGRFEREKKTTLLHEMIHAYDHYLIKHHNLWRDYLVLYLYNKILKKIGKRQLQTMIDQECNPLFMVNTAHGILFLLKSLDLDIRLNKKFGTIFAYGRKEHFKDLNSNIARGA